MTVKHSKAWFQPEIGHLGSVQAARLQSSAILLKHPTTFEGIFSHFHGEKKNKIRVSVHYTEVGFTSFPSSGFIIAIVMNWRMEFVPRSTLSRAIFERGTNSIGQLLDRNFWYIVSVTPYLICLCMIHLQRQN